MTAKLPEPRRDYSAPEYDVDAVDRAMMARCIELARRGVEEDEHPFASVIARRGSTIGESTNQIRSQADQSRHAEIIAIAQARQMLGINRLNDCTLYSVVEPCPMCAFCIRTARIGRSGVRNFLTSFETASARGACWPLVLRASELVGNITVKNGRCVSSVTFTVHRRKSAARSAKRENIVTRFAKSTALECASARSLTSLPMLSGNPHQVRTAESKIAAY